MNIKERKKRFNKQLKTWEEEKELIILEQDLQTQKNKIKNRYKKERKKLTTTKFLMLFLFISCSVIQAVTIILTFLSLKMGIVDFSALQSLITAVVAQVVGFAVYSLKSLKQNTAGGIVYETALLNAQLENVQNENKQEAVG